MFRHSSSDLSGNINNNLFDSKLELDYDDEFTTVPDKLRINLVAGGGLTKTRNSLENGIRIDPNYCGADGKDGDKGATGPTGPRRPVEPVGPPSTRSTRSTRTTRSTRPSRSSRATWFKRG